MWWSLVFTQEEFLVGVNSWGIVDVEWWEGDCWCRTVGPLLV